MSVLRLCFDKLVRCNALSQTLQTSQGRFWGRMKVALRVLFTRPHILLFTHSRSRVEALEWDCNKSYTLKEWTGYGNSFIISKAMKETRMADNALARYWYTGVEIAQWTLWSGMIFYGSYIHLIYSTAVYLQYSRDILRAMYWLV